jgi:hypothetical protein
METLYYRKIAEIAKRDSGDHSVVEIAERVLATGHDTRDRIRKSDRRALRSFMLQWIAAHQEITK